MLNLLFKNLRKLCYFLKKQDRKNGPILEHISARMNTLMPRQYIGGVLIHFCPAKGICYVGPGLFQWSKILI